MTRNQATTYTASHAQLSAAQCEEYARTNARLTVQDYLPRTSHDGAAAPKKCEWSSHVASNLTPEETGALAWVLADTMMKARFGPATQLYDAWRQHTLAGTRIPSRDRKAIQAFIMPVFGLPDTPKSEDHLQGHVAEWLWHLLTKGNQGVRFQPDPKPEVADGGGDGYSIYENSTGALRFRLWESKKNTGSKAGATSLNRAYEQIRDSGQCYVAKIVGAFSPGSYDTELLAFIADVPAAWTEGSELIGAGVTLVTNQALQQNPFMSMDKKLLWLDKPGQLRGLVTSISCYDELTKTVRRFVWTAL